MDELEIFELDYPISLRKRGIFKILRHSIINETLKVYKIVDIDKINVILIDDEPDVYMADFTNDNFKEQCIRVLDKVKRKIPILIKKTKYNFDELENHYRSGEFKHFENIIRDDKRRLSESICSFSEFKQFAKRNGLKYVVEKICTELEFRKLFIS